MRRVSILATTLLLCAAACDPEGDEASRAAELDDAIVEISPTLLPAPASSDDADGDAPVADVPLVSPLDPQGDGGATCVKYGTGGTGTLKSSACKADGPVFTIPPEWLGEAENHTFETARTACADSGHAQVDGGVQRCAAVCGAVGKLQFTGIGPDTCVDDVVFAVSGPTWKAVPASTCAAGLGQFRYQGTTTASCGCRCQ
ncbi:MAG: hypothetical protein IPH07_11465 [Deltaproteobacteria bacterium]|nr:hypothetical protein [Deltaproteobacteria bacterium]MBK8237362.1 hypothetical protein [Deltaproteobacteria bacterium]MBK8720372.1 hypothetical protein [Deltaproteobacteria bacterium]MBP7285487.1 hypothetical protein [Nannocystaceae bacterium]